MLSLSSESIHNVEMSMPSTIVVPAETARDEDVYKFPGVSRAGERLYRIPLYYLLTFFQKELI
jgi:hypothetical protein